MEDTKTIVASVQCRVDGVYGDFEHDFFEARLKEAVGSLWDDDQVLDQDSSITRIALDDVTLHEDVPNVLIERGNGHQHIRSDIPMRIIQQDNDDNDAVTHFEYADVDPDGIDQSISDLADIMAGDDLPFSLSTSEDTDMTDRTRPWNEMDEETRDAVSQLTRPKIVIDKTDGHINSVTTDRAADVIEVDYGDEAYKNAVEMFDITTQVGGENTPATETIPVPYDIYDQEGRADEGGALTRYDSEENSDYVDAMHDYANDPVKVKSFAELAEQFMASEQQTEEDEDE